MLKAVLRFNFWLQLLFPLCIFAQPRVNTPNLLFTHITTKDGLSYNEVNCIFKDSRGFIWIGTSYGLNRYDANAIITWYHSPREPHSLAGNHIQQITEDHDGHLWIATTDGLSKMNLRSGLIENFYHSDTAKNALPGNNVTSVLVDNEGTLWVGTENGLEEFDKKAHAFIHHRNNKESDSAHISRSNNIRKIYQDSEKQIWVCCYQYLYLFDRKTSAFKRFAAPVTSSNTFIDNLYTDIFEDHLHQLWLTCWGGGLKKYR